MGFGGLGNGADWRIVRWVRSSGPLSRWAQTRRDTCGLLNPSLNKAIAILLFNRELRRPTHGLIGLD